METHNTNLFWTWFYCNEISLRNLPHLELKLQEIFLYWLNRQLHNYCNGLEVIIVYPKKAVEKLQLLICPDATEECFEKATNFVNTAPDHDRWSFSVVTLYLKGLDETEADTEKLCIIKDILLKDDEGKFSEDLALENIITVVCYRNHTIYCNNKSVIPVIKLMRSQVNFFNPDMTFIMLPQQADHDENEPLRLVEFQYYIDQFNKLGH